MVRKMNLPDFNNARRLMQHERFNGIYQTTFDLAIARTEFEERQARRIISLTEKIDHKQALRHRKVQERRILRAQKQRRRWMELKETQQLQATFAGLRVRDSFTIAVLA
jgi:hypothetical protein